MLLTVQSWWPRWPRKREFSCTLFRAIPRLILAIWALLIPWMLKTALFLTWAAVARSWFCSKTASWSKAYPCPWVQSIPRACLIFVMKCRQMFITICVPLLWAAWSNILGLSKVVYPWLVLVVLLVLLPKLFKGLKSILLPKFTIMLIRCKPSAAFLINCETILLWIPL